MQKQCIIIVILLLIISLSGCQQTTSDADKFIGTWTTEPKTNPMGGNYNETRTFAANGSYYTTNLGNGHTPGAWHLTDEKLVIDTYYPSTYQYSFSENNTILHLTSITGNVTENLTKQ
jgi:hypothetical protein